MESIIVRAHSIDDAISAAGVQYCGNKLIQLMGGGYYYVEYEYVGAGEPVDVCVWNISKEDFWSSFDDDDNILDEPIKKTVFFKYKIHSVPLRLAYFIIETLRLKAQVGRLGIGNIDEPVKQAVYLLPGTKFFGREITELTEIPAEIGPVVVDRL